MHPLVEMVAVTHLGTGAALCKVLSLTSRPRLFRPGTRLGTGSGGRQEGHQGAGAGRGGPPHPLEDTVSILRLPELSGAPLLPCQGGRSSCQRLGGYKSSG